MIMTEEEYSKTDAESLKRYCNDCWYRDYGDCDKCAIGKRKVYKEATLATEPAREEKK